MANKSGKERDMSEGFKEVDYKKLKKEVEARYKKVLKEAKDEHFEALEAIEKIWAIMNHSKVSSYGLLGAAVKKAIMLVPVPFTRKDIVGAMQLQSPELARNHNHNSLGSCLRLLKKEGVIVEIEAGQGSRPAVYELGK